MKKQLKRTTRSAKLTAGNQCIIEVCQDHLKKSTASLPKAKKHLQQCVVCQAILSNLVDAGKMTIKEWDALNLL